MLKHSEILSELESRIRQAVRPYSGTPIALSGGIDSSLLAAFIKPQFAITVRLPKGTHNELQYAQLVADHLKLHHVIVDCEEDKFDNYCAKAVRAIGRPIPHFNIFPLYCMYQRLAEMGVKEVVLGDGPDEVMSGYARDLIFNYLYSVSAFEAFAPYSELIHKILPSEREAIFRLTGKAAYSMQQANMEMRKDMDDMSDGIASHFGIKNIRPYQDDPKLDEFMCRLPDELKIYQVEYGKYALRKIAEKYLPKEIAWRKVKVGGPVYPVNRLKGWLDKGEFDKAAWLAYQEQILHG